MWESMNNPSDCHISPLVLFSAFAETDDLTFTVKKHFIPFSRLHCLEKKNETELLLHFIFIVKASISNEVS